MKVLASTIFYGTKAVLTKGHHACYTGNLRGDCAVYTGTPDQSDNEIMAHGLKQTYNQARKYFPGLRKEFYRR